MSIAHCNCVVCVCTCYRVSKTHKIWTFCTLSRTSSNMYDAIREIRNLINMMQYVKFGENTDQLRPGDGLRYASLPKLHHLNLEFCPEGNVRRPNEQ